MPREKAFTFFFPTSPRPTKASRLVELLLAIAREQGEAAQVLLRAFLLEKPRGLDEAAHVPPRLLEGAAADDHLPFAWLEEAEDDLHRRRLAGAVLADEAVDVAGAQMQIHAIEGEGRPKTLAQIARLQKIFHENALSFRFSLTSPRPRRQEVFFLRFPFFPPKGFAPRPPKRGFSSSRAQKRVYNS